MVAWNVFRIAGDLSHLASKLILMLAIQSNRSAEGISHITQILYAVVFLTRYTDIFHEPSLWNLLFKIFYIGSSFFIIALMQWVYPRTRELEASWKLGGAVLGGSAVVAPFAMLILEPKIVWGFFRLLWDFSEILESVCVLPQLLLLRQTSIPTVINSRYLVALGAYRGLYLLNWLVRAFDSTDTIPNAVSVIFGIIQTALYVDFAWVYYSRQRVKLRNGGVIDSDDMDRGWLINRILGKSQPMDIESTGAHAEGSRGEPAPASRAKWGVRGISVSADEEEPLAGDVEEDAQLRDPDELEDELEEGLSEGVTTQGREWRD